MRSPKSRKNNGALRKRKWLLTVLLLAGCAANPTPRTGTTNSTSPTDDQNRIAAALVGGRVLFNYSSFYSITSPNPSTSCAGDSNTFYDPISMVLPSYPSDYTGYSGTTGPTGPYLLPTNLIDPTTTIRPSFIKNVSVDMTDANAPQASNLAFTCSLGSGTTAPPVSNCATFDYGAIDGIPSSLGGSLLLLGGLNVSSYTGIQSNYTDHGMAVSCGPVQPNLTYPTGYNACSTSMYALGVNVLPASAAKTGSTLTPGLSSASGPISTWANISSQKGYTGPRGTAGASAVYDSLLKSVVVFGGASILYGMESTGAGAPSSSTWIYNLSSQTWSEIPAQASADAYMQKTYDTDVSGNFLQLAKSSGGRALFGYAAIPGMAINQLSTTGLVTGASGSGVDTTDRIITLGGLGGCSGGVCGDAHRFNPTFGPDYGDVAAPIGTLASPSGRNPSQWIDSYPVQLISNSNSSSVYTPTEFPDPSPGPTYSPAADLSISFGFVGLLNNYASSSGMGPSGLANTIPGAGYLLVAGGFHGYTDSSGDLNVPAGGACLTVSSCGAMKIGLKRFGATVYGANERSASNFAAITNYQDISGTQNTPNQWVSINNAASPDNTPWYGGGVMLKGLDIPVAAGSLPVPKPAGVPSAEEINQVVYFGGAPCKNYMLNSTTNCGTWPGTSNPGKYWVFGIDPGYTFNAGPRPTVISWGGGTTPPGNAGMAAARGTDLEGNPLIVAWGGMSDIGTSDETGKIYYLYHNTGTSLPTWGSFTVSSGVKPKGLTNAAMVFSHVTGKFYVFGGYNPTLGTVNNTWELSVVDDSSVGALRDCGKTTTSSCQFSWKQLNASGGMTCYPSSTTCPPARRSHRMVEANYNYINPPFEPVCTSASQPCSFGIFMEGGSPDGTANYFSDRWMLDPTANGGAGHWQLVNGKGGELGKQIQVDEFPPRVLSMLANVHYTIPSSQQVIHRAVLFGGETGMANPTLAVHLGSGYFVPPTLGDTWMFDYDKRTWNRVSLFGARYKATDPNILTLTETDSRASSLVTDLSTQLLSPPPLSGGVMVTRTQSKSSHLASDPANPLLIPEVFLFGGRKKDGSYQLLSQVFKFCAGSTGEKPYPYGLNTSLGAISSPDDASCDAYDADTNPKSPSPFKTYVGRWHSKRPLGAGTTPSNLGSFMGAGTYDPSHDLVVLYGGLRPSTSYSTAAVTDSSTREASSDILEYTPPSAISPGSNSPEFNGYWTLVPACTDSPAVPQGRYGHSLSYDNLNQALVMVGGYDINGAPLLQTLTYSDGRTYQTPEVWTAYRIDSSLPAGMASRGIPALLNPPFPCYYWSKVTVFGNSIDSSTQAPPMSGISHAANVFIPSSGYNTGYYTMFDRSCYNAGPIYSPDNAVNKLLAGGAYFDIDRSQLGAHENLILNLTFIPLGTSNTGPDQNVLESDQSAVFKVHLIRVGESGDVIRQRPQPRNRIYASTEQYPKTAQDIAIIAPPTGQIRQEQIFIPLSIDPAIDRIRIERYSGSGILLDASLYRLGPH